MDSAITLEYPNGRVHEASLETGVKMVPGFQFDLYGRRWSAVKLLRLPRGHRTEEARMLCRSTASLRAPRK